MRFKRDEQIEREPSTGTHSEASAFAKGNVLLGKIMFVCTYYVLHFLGKLTHPAGASCIVYRGVRVHDGHERNTGCVHL